MNKPLCENLWRNERNAMEDGGATGGEKTAFKEMFL